MSTKEIFLHIGTHKTGTTSFQHFMSSNQDWINRFDVDFFHGRYINSNHLELHVAAMRSDRMSPIKHLFNLSSSLEFILETKSSVRNFLNNSPYKRLVFSAEGLAYLRFRDEFDRLKDILGDVDVKVIVVLREKKEFLRSYTGQLKKMGFSPSIEDRQSFLYVEPDSWLIRYDELIAAYEDAFGRDNLIVKNYDADLSESGSIIPSLLRLFDLPDHLILETKDFWLNTSQVSNLNG